MPAPIFDPQGNIVGERPTEAELAAASPPPPQPNPYPEGSPQAAMLAAEAAARAQQQNQAYLPNAGAGGSGSGGATPNADTRQTGAPGAAGVPNTTSVQPVTPEQAAAARARIEAERQSEADKTGGTRWQQRTQGAPGGGGEFQRIMAMQRPTGGGGSLQWVSSTPTWRDTPQLQTAIQQALGANERQAEIAGSRDLVALGQQSRLAAAADLEAAKAARLNEVQSQVEAQQQIDREQAADAVRNAVAQHEAKAAPDPAKYWQGLGFAGSIGMILADGLNTFASRLGGQTPVSMIERGIDRSLQKQQAEIDKAKGDIANAQGLYAQIRQGGIDQQQAFSMAKARHLENAANVVEGYARRAKTADMRATLDATKTELQKRAAMEFLSIYDSMPGGGKGSLKMVDGGGAPAMTPEKYLDLRKKFAETKKIEGEVESGPKEEKAILEIKERLGNADVAIREAKKLRDEVPSDLETVSANIPILGGALATSRQANFQRRALQAAGPGWKAIHGSMLENERPLAVQNAIGAMSSQAERRKAIDEFLTSMEETKANLAATLSNSKIVRKYEHRQVEEGLLQSRRSKLQDMASSRPKGR